MEVNLNTSTGAELRRKIENLLDQAHTQTHWADLATVNENGYPEIREMGIIHRDGLKLFLVTAKDTCKITQLKRNPKICLRVFSPERVEGVNYFGTAKLTENTARLKEFWDKAPELLSKYFSGPDDPNMVAIELAPDYLDYVSQAQKAKETKTRLVLR